MSMKTRMKTKYQTFTQRLREAAGVYTTQAMYLNILSELHQSPWLTQLLSFNLNVWLVFI